MTVIVKHSKTNAISDWTQAQLDEQISLGNFAPGTTLAQIVLPSDWNNDHTLTGVGTMAEQNANSVAITGGSINGTTIGATTPSTGKFTSVTTPSVTASSTDLTLSAISTGAVKFNTLGGNQVQITDATTAGQYTLLSRGNALNEQQIVAMGTANLGLYATGGGVINFWTATTGEKQFVVSRTASAVNYVQVTGAATTGKPVISAQGSDANITLALSGKGGGVQLYQNGTSSPLMFEAVAIGSAVNYLRATPSITGQASSLSAQGTDTNISMAFQPKGTGAIDLAAGSSGVNISNGGTVTAITRTNAGSGYTSFPTPVISAPTTAGGVQAVATVGSMLAGNPTTIQSGGTGYTVNDTLTIVGGTPTATSATYTVTAVSGGVVTAVTALNFAQYTALPTNPVSTTGGTGTGCTLNVTYGLGTSPSFNISNAGSGYIEQPTVTFSGGGGSGASAIAKVGTGTTFKSLGGTSSFNTYAGEGLRINNDGFATLTDYVEVQGGASVSGAYIGVNGSTATASLYVSGKGGGTVDFFTNGQGNTRQARVSHTASAVNYVQVTGSATGGTPTISAQGSDANINLFLNAKGTGNVFAQIGGANVFQAAGSSTSANRILVQANNAGTAPVVQSVGSDTNIDLALTPKGTGRVKFGTYTANMALTVQGYIEILDSGGTIRKLAVIA